MSVKMGEKAYHGSHAPDVGAGTPLGSEDDFRGAILTGLNVVGKVMAHPAGISQVSDLD